MYARAVRGEFVRSEDSNELVHRPSNWAYGHTVANRIYRRKLGLENGAVQLELLSISRQCFVPRPGLWPGECVDNIRPFSIDRVAPGLGDKLAARHVAQLWESMRPVFGPEPHPRHPSRPAWDALKARERGQLMAKARETGLV